MKTEKEKMLTGEVYNCADIEPLNRWHIAKRLQKEYNDTLSENKEQLSNILDELIGSKGKNVWIGGNSTILAGVSIGDETTIGAGSVVTHNIPSRCIAVGNPCRIIRYL